MELSYQPEERSIVACDFSGFRVPEMTKTRPVVVLRKSRMNRKLVTVIPLSSKMPWRVMPYHYEFPENPIPNATWPISWAICDMVVTVSIDRLHHWTASRKQRNVAVCVSDSDFKRIREAVANALGLASTDTAIN